MKIKTTMKYYFTHVTMVIIKVSSNVEEDVEKREPCTLLVGMPIVAATMEKRMEFPETKNRTSI